MVNDVTCVGITLGVMLLTGVILFAVSFDTLTPVEVGLKYNRVAVVVEPEVYNNGRYFLGLGRKFIVFPQSLQLIEFKGATALRAWSKEGQLVTLDMSMDYRIIRDEVFPLWQRYGEDYHSRLVQAAVRAVKQISMRYEATEFFNKREKIGDEMEKALKTRFRDEFCNLMLFNLRKIDLPQDFEQKVVDKVVMEQTVQITVNQKEIALISANISVIRGEGDAEVDEILNTAYAQSNVTVQNALSENTRLLREAEARAYGEFIDRLGISGEDLLGFRWAQTQSELPSSKPAYKYLVGLDSPVLQVART